LNVEKKKLDDILERKGIGKTNSGEISNSGNIPFYSATASNPSGFNKTFDFDESEYFLFAKSGGNKNKIFGNNMGIGKFWLIKGKSCGNVAMIKFNNKKQNIILNEYLNNYFNYKLFDIQKLANYTTGNGNIDMDVLINIEIPVPSKQTQEHIVKECQYYDNLIESLKKENERLQNNNIIDMVLKSVSKDKEIIIDSEPEDDDEKPQPKQKEKVIKIENEEKPIKTNKKTKNITV
jgi:restriction endonuclease S subunit